MPPKKPIQVAHKFLDVMQDSLLDALILATEDLAATEPSESLTVADQCMVATLTYRVGFTHLNRTAQLYRAKYGESPAQTLKGNMLGLKAKYRDKLLFRYRERRKPCT